MSSVAEHYENLLAKHYTWMTGRSFEENVAGQKELLADILGAKDALQTRGLAVDLGCGPGFQAVALAQLGFPAVLAVDQNEALLAELKSHCDSQAIETRQGDLMELDEILGKRKAAAVVCMGDTLTHLPTKEAVRELFHDVSKALDADGIFAITYRDLSHELSEGDRFILVRGDDVHKIMTCILEYEDADAVTVNDLVHVRTGSGWALEKSSYRKLRLAEEWVADALIEAGLAVRSRRAAGRLALIVAEKS